MVGGAVVTGDTRAIETEHHGLFVKADVCWHEPFVPTVQGQYLIKDVVLITAAMVIGGTLRSEHSEAGVRT